MTTVTALKKLEARPGDVTSLPAPQVLARYLGTPEREASPEHAEYGEEER